MDENLDAGGRLAEDDVYLIEFRNGNGAGVLTELPNGAVYGSLKEAARKRPELFETTVLFGDFTDDGAFLYVPRDVVLDKPIRIIDRYYSEKGRDAFSCTNIVMVDANAVLKVQYMLEAEGEDPFAINKRIRLFFGANSTLEQSEIIDNCVAAKVFSDMVIYQMSESHTELNVIKVGEGDSKFLYASDLKWPGAETKYSFLYLCGANERVDVDIAVKHNAPDCRSDVLVKGIAGGNAVGSFKGLVYVAPDAQRTEAYQQSRNILLCDGAQILTSPQLEIYADDVRCSHGATVGQQDGDEVYYMRQRGISEEQARSLQMTGFMNDILDRLPEGTYRDIAAGKLDDKLQKIK